MIDVSLFIKCDYISFIFMCVCVCVFVCVCVCVKERKERGREIGKAYSMVSSYQIREMIFQNLILKSFRVGNKLLNSFEDGAIGVAI